MPDPRRRERLASLIEQILSQVVARELRDPGIAEIISITRVELAADVSVARVHVSVMGDEDARSATMRALERAGGYVRRRLASELSIRQVPELIWALDRSIERGDRVIALLNSLVIPPAPPEDEPPTAGVATDDGDEDAPAEVRDDGDGAASGDTSGRRRIRLVLPRLLPVRRPRAR